MKSGRSMLKDHIAKYYFVQNFNCAETILRAANDYYDLQLHDKDMIMVGAYGAGIQAGNTCGAVLSVAAILLILPRLIVTVVPGVTLES